MRCTQVRQAITAASAGSTRATCHHSRPLASSGSPGIHVIPAGNLRVPLCLARGSRTCQGAAPEYLAGATDLSVPVPARAHMGKSLSEKGKKHVCGDA